MRLVIGGQVAIAVLPGLIPITELNVGEPLEASAMT